MSGTIFMTNIYFLMKKSLKNDIKSLGSVIKKFLKFKIWKFRQFWVWIRTKLAGAKLSNILNKFLQNSFFVFLRKVPFWECVSWDWPKHLYRPIDLKIKRILEVEELYDISKIQNDMYSERNLRLIEKLPKNR